MRRRLLTASCALALGLLACGGDDEAGTAGDDRAGAPPGDGEAATAQGGCRKVSEPKAKPDGGETRPRKRLARARTYEVQLVTNCGDFTITLDQKRSPKAAASFASLARRDFFDGTIFHRIAPGFVIQGGDPTGTGSGGPGYKTRDKVRRGTVYGRGVVAMAKADFEDRGTAGSQFFVVTGPNAELPPDYAVLGKVTEGIDAVERIGRLGSSSEQPTAVVLIEDARVRVRR